MTAVVLTSFAFASGARADDTHDTASADTLFRDGKTLFAQGHTSDACAKFASSYHIDPQVGTLLFLATCHEAEGKTASAWNEFHAAQSAMQAAPNALRETYVRQHLDGLSGKLSRLVLAVQSPPTGLEIRVDDQRIEADALGVPMPVDPGPHTIAAAAPDRRPWSTTIDVAEGPADASVTVPALESDAPAPPPPAAAAPPALAQPQAAAPATPAPTPPVSLPIDRPAAQTGGGNAPIAWVAGGIGLAGVGVGVATGVVALLDRNAADSGSCDGKYCTAHGLDLYSRATTAAWVSTGAFAAGAAGLAVAASALLLGHRAPRAESGVRVLPTVGGLQVDGAW